MKYNKLDSKLKTFVIVYFIIFKLILRLFYK